MFVDPVILESSLQSWVTLVIPQDASHLSMELECDKMQYGVEVSCVLVCAVPSFKFPPSC